MRTRLERCIGQALEGVRSFFFSSLVGLPLPSGRSPVLDVHMQKNDIQPHPSPSPLSLDKGRTKFKGHTGIFAVWVAASMGAAAVVAMVTTITEPSRVQCRIEKSQNMNQYMPEASCIRGKDDHSSEATQGNTLDFRPHDDLTASHQLNCLGVP